MLYDALTLKSTRSYTSCTWSCSERTDYVRTLTRPRKLRTGSYWIHPHTNWRMEASRRVVPPLTLWWLRQLGRVEACLTFMVQSKNTWNVWNTNRYHNTIVKLKLMHNLTHKICPLRKHAATTGKRSQLFFYAVGTNFCIWMFRHLLRVLRVTTRTTPFL